MPSGSGSQPWYHSNHTKSLVLLHIEKRLALRKIAADSLGLVGDRVVYYRRFDPHHLGLADLLRFRSDNPVVKAKHGKILAHLFPFFFFFFSSSNSDNLREPLCYAARLCGRLEGKTCLVLNLYGVLSACRGDVKNVTAFPGEIRGLARPQGMPCAPVVNPSLVSLPSEENYRTPQGNSGSVYRGNVKRVRGNLHSGTKSFHSTNKSLKLLNIPRHQQPVGKVWRPWCFVA